jgi:hypothetical protein
MELELTTQEAELVDRIFKHYLPELRDEVYHTENHKFRESLELDESVLKVVMGRLDALRAENKTSG